MLCLAELEGADWCEGPNHTIQDGLTRPRLDVELVEERESVAEDLVHFAGPNGKSSSLCLILQRPTITTALPPMKSVASSSYRTQGVFGRIVNRYTDQACLGLLPAMASHTMHDASSPLGNMRSLERA
jgi:hypothetical protein